MRHFGVLSLTQHHQRSDSIRCAFLYYFLSFPFRHHQSQLKAKLVPNSHPFSIEYPHQSTTLAFRVFGFLSLHTIPYHSFFSWFLDNNNDKLKPHDSQHQPTKNGRNKFGFLFHLGLLLFLWFLFCLLYKFSCILKWVLLFYWTLQVYVYPKVKVREQEDQEDFKGPSLLPSNDDSSFPGITCFSLSYFFFLNFLYIINLI